MSTVMTPVTGGSMPVQAKRADRTSAPAFGAEMQNALSSAAAGTQPQQNTPAAGRTVTVLEGSTAEDQMEGLAVINDLLSVLSTVPSPASGQPARDMPGMQSFLPGTPGAAPLLGTAQTAAGEQAAAETPASSAELTGAGNSPPGKGSGFLAAPVPGAGPAAEAGSPAAALLPQGAEQGSGTMRPSGPAAAGITAAAATGTSFADASAAGLTAAPAQLGGFVVQGAAPNGTLGDAQLGVSPAQLFAAAAGQQPTTAAPMLAAPAATSAAVVSPPLNTQLQGPLFSLAAAKPGEHTMTISVTPDDLGPVTIRAQIGVDGVRVELFAPNDAGREALRAILQDLKRDLASAGLGTGLDLSSQNQPDEPGTDGSERPRDSANQDDTTGRQLRGPGHHAGPYLRLSGSDTGLDVLA
jgi:flagellar hook-length control protein FliK